VRTNSIRRTADPAGFMGHVGYAALWLVTGIGMLTINSPWPMSSTRIALYTVALVGGAVLGLLHPAGGLASAVVLAQQDERCYAVVAFAAFLYGRRAARTAGWGQVCAVLVGPAVAGAWVADPLPAELTALPAELIAFAVSPWLLGRYRRGRVALHERGWARAARLEREHGLIAERTRLRERARIARDMHDSLGHDLSLLALRAAAFEVDPALTEEQRAQARALRVGAGDATERLHEIVGVLREPHESAPTTPLREDVDTLVERCRASGMDVRYRPTPPNEADADLPDMVGLAVHRIVREALTNAAKHAPGATVRVAVTRVGDTTTVDVTNGPARRTGGAAPIGSGHGLVGMRERARLLGGTLDAGPHSDGHRVVARLPHHAAPAAPPPTEDRVTHDRRLRRGFVKAAAWAAAGVVLAMSVSAFVTRGAAIDPDDFRRMHVGDRRADLERWLPEDRADRTPRHPPPTPAGAACEYFTDGDILPENLFRLCFAHDVLVAKDVVSLSGEPADT